MKIALTQINNKIGAIKNNTQKIINFCLQAQENNADLIILPLSPISSEFANDLFRYKKFNEDIKYAITEISQKINTPILIKQRINFKHNIYLIKNGTTSEIKEKFEIKNTVFSIKKSVNSDYFIEFGSKPFNIDIDRIKKAKKSAISYIFVNNVGVNEEYICDGESFVLNKKGELILKAKQFKEEIVYFNTLKHITIKDSAKNREKQIFYALCFGLKDFCKKIGFKKIVLGLSGGIDSAITAVLAVNALGAKNVLGIMMPSEYSSAGSINDSKQLAKNLKMECLEIPIKSMFQIFIKDVQTKKYNDKAEENLQARIRSLILMNYSNRENSLLLSTGNKSEVAVGYCTLYGDTCGGLNLIADLFKTEIYKLADYINKNEETIPAEILKKSPSAELAPNQKDQDTLPPYEILDEIIKMYLKYDNINKVSKKYDKKIVEKVFNLIKIAEFKRKQACLSFKISNHNFGSKRIFATNHDYNF